MSSIERRRISATWWRSLDDLADAPRFRTFLGAEFPSEADPEGIDRRRWLQLMGASLALAGAGGCRWEKQEIHPFAERPEGQTPGKSRRFATAMPLGDSAIGLWVTTVDGRPIKIEGNPHHPQSLGATDVFAQAAILQLYDPDRSRSVFLRAAEGATANTWDQFAEFCRGHFARLHEAAGAGFHVLAEASSSPTLDALRSELLRVFPKAGWSEYEPLGDDNERAGSALALGRPLRTQLALDAARLILCLDADPLGAHPAAVRYAHDFAAGREPVPGRMNRLYVVESSLSLTGASADHRLPLRSTQIPALIRMLEREVADGIGQEGGSESLSQNPSPPAPLPASGARGERFGIGGDSSSKLGERVAGVERSEPPDRRISGGSLTLDPGHPKPAHPNLELLSEPGGRTQQFVRAVAQDLLKPENRGRSVVCIGPGQPPEAQAAVHRINSLLGNVGQGKTVSYTQVPQPQRPAYAEAIKTLADAIRAGSVTTLLILGGNPVYNAPGDLSFGDAVRKVETTIHLSPYRNETSRQCMWHLPQAHFLESWGDVRSYDGTYSVIQPMIAPLFGGRCCLEVLAMILQTATPKQPVGRPEELVRRTFRKIAGEEEAAWQRTVRDGLLADSHWPVESVSAPHAAEHPAALPVSEPQEGQLEVVFCRDASVYDGRFGNNSWLQELPDPITRLTWGNAALVSPADAWRLGIENETLVTLKLGDRPPARLPAYVMPGQASGSITLPWG